MTGYASSLHRAKTATNPGIQTAEILTASEETCGKVQSSPANNSVELFNPVGVQVELSASEFSDLVFELLHRLGAHALEMARMEKPRNW